MMIFSRTMVVGFAFAISSGAVFANNPRLMNGNSIYGVPVADFSANRVVNVLDGGDIRVKCGDVVTFESGDKKFSWKFDVIGHRAVNLKNIAPAGFASAQMVVYISRNEMERP